MDALTRIHGSVISIEHTLPPESKLLIGEQIHEIRMVLIREWSRHIHAEDA